MINVCIYASWIENNGGMEDLVDIHPVIITK